MYLEHRQPLPVIRLLAIVVRMSRKHNAMYYALMGTVDRRGYGGQQTCTICDARGPYPFDLTHTETIFSPNSIDSLCLRVA